MPSAPTLSLSFTPHCHGLDVHALYFLLFTPYSFAQRCREYIAAIEKWEPNVGFAATGSVMSFPFEEYEEDQTYRKSLFNVGMAGFNSGRTEALLRELGAGGTLAGIRHGGKTVLRCEAVVMRAIEPETRIGSRSFVARLAKGKHKSGLLLDSSNFDVDAFIVSDKLAKQIPKGTWFRSGSNISERSEVQSNLLKRLQELMPGMRNIFEFRIYIEAEYLGEVAKEAHVIF